MLRKFTEKKREEEQMPTAKHPAKSRSAKETFLGYAIQQSNSSEASTVNNVENNK